MRALVFGLSVLSCVACGGSGIAPPEGNWEEWTASGTSSAAPMAVDVDLSGSPQPAQKDAWGVQKASFSGPLLVYTDPGELPELTIAGEPDRDMPLERTAVKAHLGGFMAEVEVTQTFGNPSREAIEVVYVFPLPENSAVNAMTMRVGERVIRAKIDERGEARRTYERAKQQGKTAALLEQERPNVFTQSVANIAAGEKVHVTVRYVQDLSYDDGRYEFVFPMVVGPRFIPGTPLDVAMKGTGTYHDTQRVPDASRISPPVLGKGQRSGHDISLELTADPALPVASFDVPTHDVAVQKDDDGSLKLALSKADSIPNRDFVMRYSVAGKEPIATLLTSGEDRNGYFALMVHPPELDIEEMVGRREILFVVDVSGSMAGVPIGMCKRAMRDAILRLRPVDTFNIITFAGMTEKAFPSARPVNHATIEQALSFIGRAEAGGGTYMENAVQEALAPNVAAGRHRYVFFLTDGYVGQEQEILSGSQQLVAAMEARGQKGRVFGFGVGSSVNRALIDGLSRAGNGVAVYATSREHPQQAVNTFFRYIDASVLTDVRLSWGELGTSEIYPDPLPDLFASRPIIVHGRYDDLGDEPLTLTARNGEKTLKLPVNVRKTLRRGERGGVLGQLWAREKVRWLEAESWVGALSDGPRRIQKLGLEYQLVTPYTSFIAVDESRVVGDGNPRQINQWVEVPEGVDGASAGARQHRPSETLLAPPPVERPPTVMSPVPSPAPVTSEVSQLPGMSGGEGYGAMEKEDAPTDDAEVNYASPAPPAAERGARGCGCRLVGSPDDRDVPAGALLFGLLAALVALRRHSVGPGASSALSAAKRRAIGGRSISLRNDVKPK